MDKTSPFPPVELADEQGLLAVGGNTSPEILRYAYEGGIFPWPMDEELLTWFAPAKRALLYVNELHLSRSLKRLLNNNPFEVYVDRDFDAVIEHCAGASNRKGQSGTWITAHILNGYKALHREGLAHSIEAYSGEKLVGGMYGVSIGGMFAGESMFFLEAGASKVCLVSLCQFLESQGVKWIDCQVRTDLLESFGAREVRREQFMQELKEALAKPQLSFPDRLQLKV